jgi:hypothetical protein
MAFVPPVRNIELMGEGRQHEIRETAAERELVAESKVDGDSKRQSGLTRLLERFRRAR